MNSQNRPQTAQILQFPPSGLRARSGRAYAANVKQSPSMFEMGALINTGAWYHEAAIAEADRPRKP